MQLTLFARDVFSKRRLTEVKNTSRSQWEVTLSNNRIIQF